MLAAETTEWEPDPPSGEDIQSDQDVTWVVASLHHLGQKLDAGHLAGAAWDLYTAFRVFNEIRRRRRERLSHRQCAAIMDACASAEATVRLAFKGRSRTRLVEGLRALSHIAWMLAREDRVRASKGERYDDLAALCVLGESEARCVSIEASQRERAWERRLSPLDYAENERIDDLVARTSVG